MCASLKLFVAKSDGDVNRHSGWLLGSIIIVTNKSISHIVESFTVSFVFLYIFILNFNFQPFHQEGPNRPSLLVEWKRDASCMLQTASVECNRHRCWKRTIHLHGKNDKASFIFSMLKVSTVRGVSTIGLCTLFGQTSCVNEPKLSVMKETVHQCSQHTTQNYVQMSEIFFAEKGLIAGMEGSNANTNCLERRGTVLCHSHASCISTLKRCM